MIYSDQTPGGRPERVQQVIAEQKSRAGSDSAKRHRKSKINCGLHLRLLFTYHAGVRAEGGNAHATQQIKLHTTLHQTAYCLQIHAACSWTPASILFAGDQRFRTPLQRQGIHLPLSFPLKKPYAQPVPFAPNNARVRGALEDRLSTVRAATTA